MQPADVLVFHSERDIDLNTEPFWYFDWCVSDKRATVVSEDPLRIELTLPCEGDAIQVLLDENSAVVETATVERLSQ